MFGVRVDVCIAHQTTEQHFLPVVPGNLDAWVWATEEWVVVDLALGSDVVQVGPIMVEDEPGGCGSDATHVNASLGVGHIKLRAAPGN